MKFCAHIEEASGISAREGQVLDPHKKKTNEFIECRARVCTNVGQLLFSFFNNCHVGFFYKKIWHSHRLSISKEFECRIH
jgi:hypothetical protein